MSYSNLTPPINIIAESLDNHNPLQRNYYGGVVISMGGVTETYDRVCFNLANLTIELYDSKNDSRPIATVPLVS